MRDLCTVAELIWFDLLRERIWGFEYTFYHSVKHQDHLHLISKVYSHRRSAILLDQRPSVTCLAAGRWMTSRTEAEVQRAAMLGLHWPREVACLSLLARAYWLAKSCFSIWNLSLTDSVVAGPWLAARCPSKPFCCSPQQLHSRENKDRIRFWV